MAMSNCQGSIWMDILVVAFLVWFLSPIIFSLIPITLDKAEAIAIMKNKPVESVNYWEFMITPGVVQVAGIIVLNLLIISLFIFYRYLKALFYEHTL